MPVTMRDIKEETGLSFTTISKYLNGEIRDWWQAVVTRRFFITGDNAVTAD